MLCKRIFVHAPFSSGYLLQIGTDEHHGRINFREEVEILKKYYLLGEHLWPFDVYHLWE